MGLGAWIKQGRPDPAPATALPAEMGLAGRGDYRNPGRLCRTKALPLSPCGGCGTNPSIGELCFQQDLSGKISSKWDSS
jgi:hypothetical protein